MSKKPKQFFVVPDMHWPYACRESWKVYLSVIANMNKGDEVVIIGDFADYLAVSSHAKDPDRMPFADEVEAVNEALDELAVIASKAGVSVVFCQGNHEFRLERYLRDKAPELFGIVKAEKLLNIRLRGWKWVPYKSVYKAGKVHFTHDVGVSGKHAAMRSLEAFGGNLVIGHTHRGGVAYAGNIRGEQHFCLNVGHGLDTEHIDYMHKFKAEKDWQKGFGFIQVDRATGLAYAQFIPIVRNRCVLNGKVYKA